MKSIFSIVLTFMLFLGLQVEAYSEAGLLPKISPEEAEGLKQMREEEKLAYDVYMNLYEKWELPVFYNIAQSEKRHMSVVGQLLKDFSIEDPYISEPGVFSDKELQILYNDLVKKGHKSITDALKVGATIEDLDIADLDKLLANTKNEDIRMSYENLNKGSRNHLRTYNDLLMGRDSRYEPQFLSQGRFDEIITSPMERGAKNNGTTKIKTKQGGCKNTKCKSNKGGSCSSKKGTQGKSNRQTGSKKGKGRI